MISAPDVLEPGVAYVSMEYATVLHLCCCGCGTQVVTPLSPARWELRFDGETISLYPSVGRWSLPCQSHYWIRRNEVRWDRPFTGEEIAWVRERDRADIDGHAQASEAVGEPAEVKALTWMKRLTRWLSR